MSCFSISKTKISAKNNPSLFGRIFTRLVKNKYGYYSEATQPISESDDIDFKDINNKQFNTREISSISIFEDNPNEIHFTYFELIGNSYIKKTSIVNANDSCKIFRFLLSHLCFNVKSGDTATI